MLINPIIFGGGAANVISSVTLIGYTNDTSGATTYTFSSVSLGTPVSTTHLVVPIQWNKGQSRTPLSLTIDGDSMTKLAGIDTTTSFNTGTAIFYKKITTDYGTSANFVLTMNAGCNGASLGVLTFHRSGTITTVDTLTNRSNGGTSATGTIDVSANGLLVGVGGYGSVDAGTPTFSAGITDDTAVVNTGNFESVIGFDTFAAAESGRTVTVSGGAGNDDYSMTVVSLL